MTFSRLLRSRRSPSVDIPTRLVPTAWVAVAYLVLAVVALFLVALGAALVLDLMSLRMVLASLEARPFLRIAIRAHVLLQHDGAQVVEASAGVVGLVTLGWLGWRLYPSLSHPPAPGTDGNRNARPGS